MTSSSFRHYHARDFNAANAAKKCIDAVGSWEAEKII